MAQFISSRTKASLAGLVLGTVLTSQAALAQTAASTNWNKRIERITAEQFDHAEPGYVRLFIDTTGSQNINVNCEFKKPLFRPGTWKISGFGDLTAQLGQQLRSINEANQTWGIALRVAVPGGTNNQSVPFELPILAYELNKQTRDCNIKSANRRYLSPLMLADSSESVGVDARVFFSSTRAADTVEQVTKIGNTLNLYADLPMRLVGPALAQMDRTFLREGEARIAATHTEEFIPRLDRATVLTVFLEPEIADSPGAVRAKSTVQFEHVRSVFSRPASGAPDQDDLAWISNEGPGKIIDFQIGYRGPNGQGVPVPVYEMVRQMVGPVLFDNSVQPANSAEKINTACLMIKGALANKGFTDLDIAIITWAFGARVGGDWRSPEREYLKASCITQDGPTLKKAGIELPTPQTRRAPVAPPSGDAMNLSLGLVELVAGSGNIDNYAPYFADSWTVFDFTGQNLFGPSLSTQLNGQQAIQSFLKQNIDRSGFPITYPNAGDQRMDSLFAPGFNTQPNVRISESLISLKGRPGEVYWAIWESDPYADGYKIGAITRLAIRQIDDAGTRSRFLARHPQAGCEQGDWCPLRFPAVMP